MTNFIYTIDVEGHDGDDPVSKLIYGNLDNGNKIGIDLIMDCLDKHNITGLFFVDIAEAWDYGEEKVANVMLHIRGRGHDVGVHIHPDHMADINRMFLYEYSIDEQREIITKCTNFYKKVLGAQPIAFRAGKYGANKDTLDILVELGYKVDFSEFYGQKWCGLVPPVTSSKTVRLENGLIEVPVTVYRSFYSPFYNRIDKIDDSMRLDEFKYVLKRILTSHNNDNIVLFSHSFSLMKWRENPSNPCLDNKAKKKLIKMLQYIDTLESARYVSIEQLISFQYDSYNCLFDIPRPLKGIVSWYFFIMRAIKVIKMRKASKKGKLTR